MPVIPLLSLPDPDAAAAFLMRQFGFVPDGGMLRLGSQAIALTAGPVAGHGTIDHLALAVPDLATALAEALSRGAQLDPAVTPDGPLEIPEFQAAGVRYAFLQGPGGARIELIQNLAAPHGPGHDHIGIPCRDIAAVANFLGSLGAAPSASVTLHRPEGDTQVRFLAFHGSVLELYQTPAPDPNRMGPGLWHRLLMPGIAPVTGPEGLTLAPA